MRDCTPSAGHRAARVHYVALERHQAEGVFARALYADARLEIFRHDRAAEQVVHHALIAGIEPNQFRSHAQAARQAQNLALARVEHPRAHRADRQKRRPAEAVVAQILDHALGVFVALDDDVLQRAAQNHVHGALELLGNLDQFRHDAVHARNTAFARVEQHLLDRVLIALVVVLHLHQ